MSITVSQLRAALEHIPGDVVVLLDTEQDHKYHEFFETQYTTALDPGPCRHYIEDIFISDEIGEVTKYGTRIKAFVLRG